MTLLFQVFVKLMSFVSLVSAMLASVSRTPWFLVVGSVCGAVFSGLVVTAMPELVHYVMASPVRPRGSMPDYPPLLEGERVWGLLVLLTVGARALAQKQFRWLLLIVLTSIVPVALIWYLVREWMVVCRLRRDRGSRRSTDSAVRP